MKKMIEKLLIPTLLLSAILIYLRNFQIPYAIVSYQESDALLLNPGRGFYVQFDSSDTGGFYSLKEKNISVILLTFDIKEYTEQEISQEKLNELQSAFDQARQFGLSVVFRAGYDFRSDDLFSDPKDLNLIKRHIQQVKPILHKNQDVLLGVQAGFLGAWGEWHSSNHADETGHIPANVINQVVEELCDAVPPPITIALRRPRFIRVLDAKRIDLNRIGFHNDALFASDNDLATYDDKNYSREQELEYIYNRIGDVANGGEMPWISEFTMPERATSELRSLRLQYLNNEYNKAVLEDWAKYKYNNQNFLEYVRTKLGYQLSLKQAKIPQKFRQGKSIDITLTVVNNGFGGLAVPYSAELVVTDGQKKYTYPLKFDSESLFAGSTVNLSATIKEQFEGENLQFGLRIFNAHENLYEDTRYSIILSNEDVVYKSGINQFAIYNWDEDQSKFVLLGS